MNEETLNDATLSNATMNGEDMNGMAGYDETTMDDEKDGQAGQEPRQEPMEEPADDVIGEPSDETAGGRTVKIQLGVGRGDAVGHDDMGDDGIGGDNLGDEDSDYDLADDLDVDLDLDLDVDVDLDDDVDADDEPAMRPQAVADTGDSPHVVLAEMGGEVVVEGWAQSIVTVRCDEHVAPTIVIEDDVVRVKAASDAIVRVPHGASLEAYELCGDTAVKAVRGDIKLRTTAGDLLLKDVGGTTIETVGGDVAVAEAAGDLNVSMVGGDVHLRGVGQTAIGTVGGSLRGKRIRGDLTAQTIGGDVVVKDVAGSLLLDQVGAGLRASKVEGDVVATTGSGVQLSVTPSSGRTYTLNAGSGVRCKFPIDAGLKVSITSGAGRIDIQGAEDVVQDVGGLYTEVFGDGGANLNIAAGSGVALRFADASSDENGWGEFASAFSNDFTADFGDWSQDMAQRLRVHATKLTDQVSERLGHVAETIPDVLIAAGMSTDEADRIAARVQRAAEDATIRVQRTTERAAKRAEKKLDRAQRKAERHAARAEGRAARRERRGHRGPRHAKPGASADERLAILRMLEEGRITADEAERLLSALGGR